MSRLVLLGPTTLVGKELIDALRGHPLAADLHLASMDDEEIGQLTDAAGAAALVVRAERDEIAAADVVVACGDVAPYEELLAARRDGATVVLAGPDAGEGGAGTPVVAGVNLDAAEPGGTLVSPDAGGVLVAHLLHPLVAGGGFAGGVARAVATLVRPVSVFDRPGLDELFAQAGRMVSMQSQSPSALFGHRQLAFNLYPAPRPPRRLTAQVREALGAGGLELSVQVLQGAVFHGVSALVHVTLGEAADPGALRKHLGRDPAIELYRPDDGAVEQLGPLDVPTSDKVLVGAVHRDPDDASGTGFWLWAVMDNLTRGGALNVLAILERVTGTPAAS